MLRAALVAALIAVSLLAWPATPFAQSGCGVKPIKPIKPIGCKDLVPECQCDQNGRNCKWVWVCVKAS